MIALESWRWFVIGISAGCLINGALITVVYRVVYGRWFYP